MRIRSALLVIALACGVLAGLPLAAADPEPTVVREVYRDTSPPLRDLVAQSPGDDAYLDGEINPLGTLQKVDWALPDGGMDPSVIQDGFPEGGPAMPPPIVSFDGIVNNSGISPPDTVGAIGPDHYVQMVNVRTAMFDRTGTIVLGPFSNSVFWDGMGTQCDSTNSGDPIVLYDHLADRWLVSQFSLNFPNNFHQCIAISTTGDPTGSYHRYDFAWISGVLNDYPHFGVWPDAYYMAVNQFDGATFNWRGQGVAAFERDQMLNGAPAQMIIFDLFAHNPNFGGMIPTDWEGSTPPPAGAPNAFFEWDDGTWIPPVDALRMWNFHVDFAVPGNSTFGAALDPDTTINTADVDPDLACGRDCIPQPGTGNRIDAIADRLMHRLSYRNFGTHESWVGNHTVDGDGTNRAGVHWFELRDSGVDAIPTMHQQGVFAPAGSEHRWMGSVAQNADGDIALGYSLAGSATFPSVYYAGRLAEDPLGMITLSEASMVDGGGSQTGSNRWGDYSSLNIDPVDDCTFWYTQEYYAATSSVTWATRIGAFAIPDCTAGVIFADGFESGGTGAWSVAIP